MRAVLIITLALCAAMAGGCEECGNRVAGTVVSPNGMFKAIVFERDCGASTDFSTHVSILPAAKILPNESGNAFVADANHRSIPLDSHGAMNITLTWKGDTHVEIAYPGMARVFLQAPSASGVGISYRSE